MKSIVPDVSGNGGTLVHSIPVTNAGVRKRII